MLKFHISFYSILSFVSIFTLVQFALSFELVQQYSIRQSYDPHIIKSQQIKLAQTDPIRQCDGNRYQFMSQYVLGRQNDLTQTFAEIEKSININNVSYSDRPGRTYTIYNLKPHLLYLQAKQIAKVREMNVLNISGGSVRTTYTFQWSKEQIGSKIIGNGTGLVSSDPVSFQKTLQTNQNHQLEWTLTKALPIKISNSLTVQTFTPSPYKEDDYKIVLRMLNELDNITTVKSELITALNANFTSILKRIVKLDQTIKIPKQIEYTWHSYQGQFTAIFDNMLLKNGLDTQGLSLLLSQTIKGDKQFQCGEKVPFQPQSLTTYGGTQQYMSNKLLKSTINYALRNLSLDVTLSQIDWQSRAFQFRLGDLHEVMASTKPLSSFKQLNGNCSAHNDNTYSFEKKTISSYAVKINFTCSIFQNLTKIIEIVLPVDYEISPSLTSKELNFKIKDIKGTPTFIETSKYKMTNPDLAAFMLMQTLNTAKNSLVIGSGYKTRTRKLPKFEVRDQYLFLYDKSS